jgi:hypothetical protein
LWDAGILIPLAGASAKESNRELLGGMRTYVRAVEGSWVEGVRAGFSVASSGPLLTLEVGDGRATAVVSKCAGKLEIIADGHAIASDESGLVSVTLPHAVRWIAARCISIGGPSGVLLAHTSPVAVSALVRESEAVKVLVTSIAQTRAWCDEYGRYENPRRKQALLERCAEAIRVLEGRP